MPLETLGTGLSLPVPHLDLIVPIDHVEADWKGVDDQVRELSLLPDLPGSRGQLIRKVFGQQGGVEKRTEQFTDPFGHLAMRRAEVPRRQQVEGAEAMARPQNRDPERTGGGRG
jgi:hypothetical protein